MVGSSKILTVSYGTFSCTLEGFDDSFETMKAIAEYFRDLAADDRYFGAEPATPDADMLARIAEREISRRVQAHEDRGRIVLRTEPAQALPEAAEPATIAEPTTSPALKATSDATADVAPVEEPVIAAEPAPGKEPEGIEAEMIGEQSETVEETAETEAGELPQEIAAPEAIAAHAEAAQIDADVSAEKQAIAGDIDAESELAAIPELDAEPKATSFMQGDSLAAKLSLIRSVVSDAAPSEVGEFSEDEHAQDFLDDTTERQDAVAAADDLAGWFQGGDELEEEVEETDIGKENGPEPRAFAAHDEFEDTLAELMADAVSTPEPVSAARERFLIADKIEIEAAEERDPYEDDENEVTDAFQDLFRPEAPRLAPEMDADLNRDKADVDADLRLEFDDLPEEEADLDAKEEGIAAEQDIETDDMAESSVAPRGSAADVLLPGREKLQKAEDTGDLMRFFDEADTQLEAPAASQRRNAIQHLRAAVAATRAERKAGSELHRNVDETPYRSDLASVVRPRRPQVHPEGGRSVRPDEPRPAPLKLVAEQRIDMPRAPIRPRRISGAALRAEIEQVQADSGFSTFAEELGLTRLPDLIEAAAAYLSDVEGRPQFSRPMLMSKLREVAAEEYSREEGLRSFGQLLRAGKLQKLSGGRFAVTDETEYRQRGKRQAG